MSQAEKSNTKDKAETKPYSLKSIIKDILVFGGAFMLFQSVAYAGRYIPSSSMEPTLQVGDRIFISKFSYGYSKYSLPFDMPLFEGRIFADMPERGEIVVFSPPEEGAQDFIKRVIGLPGDTIEMRGGRLYINDEIVERRLVEQNMTRKDGWPLVVQIYEETLPGGYTHLIKERGDDYPLDDTPAFVVPEGHVFVMGDNRDNSRDSRAVGGIGSVAAIELVGEAKIISFTLADCDPKGGDGCFLGLPWGRFFTILQ